MVLRSSELFSTSHARLDTRDAPNNPSEIASNKVAGPLETAYNMDQNTQAPQANIVNNHEPETDSQHNSEYTSGFSGKNRDVSSSGKCSPINLVPKPSTSQSHTSQGATNPRRPRKPEKAWPPVKSGKSFVELPAADLVLPRISVDIPHDGLGLSEELDRLKFSNRGSMVLGGRWPDAPEARTSCLDSSDTGDRTKPNTGSPSTLNPRILSTDEEVLSDKVRSYYALGTENPVGLDGNGSVEAGNGGGTSIDADQGSDSLPTITANGQSPQNYQERPFKREEHELAGGLEDWHDVEAGDVDRYGFLIPKSLKLQTPTHSGVARSSSAREPPSLQRVSTSLQLAADAPRRKSTGRRVPSNATAEAETEPSHTNGTVGRLSSRTSRPISSQSSYRDGVAGHTSRFRQATNRLPYNRDRRCMDQAADMLTLPSDVMEAQDGGDIHGTDTYLRRKEIAREDKWLQMAKVLSKREDGGGTEFGFDTSSSKLIERTWKGIPDRWRATAWHSFLTESAKRANSLSDQQLVEKFHDYQALPSPDDVQIDLDVPRTISSHIMFRRRYRGGQRLLFRALHAMSLHFPNTAYVQGMAAIAATLLAYFDEENAFVMLVRLWELRGLEKLYQVGFGGLMEALDDFEAGWLAGGEISARLVCVSLGQSD